MKTRFFCENGTAVTTFDSIESAIHRAQFLSVMTGSPATAYTEISHEDRTGEIIEFHTFVGGQEKERADELMLK